MIVGPKFFYSASESRVANDQVRLFIALGGGWEDNGDDVRTSSTQP